MTTEIFIENKRLDLTAGISSLLNFCIDDVKDFASRNTTFSKTIVLPGTANNNYLFGNIFDAKISNPYNPASENVATNFNASVSARCLMFQDHIQVFKGTLRLLEIVTTDNINEYEVAVFGELGGLVSAIGAAKIEALDFSAYDFVFSVANIEASWSNTPGSGVFIPSNIDYGTYSDNKHDWDYKGMRPALYVKEYIDKIFAAANYTYESTLFGTDRFKRLVIPHNRKVLTFNTSDLLTASRTTDQVVIGFAFASTGLFAFPVVDSTIFTPGGGVNDFFTYNAADPINVILSWTFNYHWLTTGNIITIEVQKNGVAVATNVLFDTGGSTQSGAWTSSVAMSLVTGDDISFEVSVNSSATNFNFTLTAASIAITSPSDIPVPVVIGDTIQVNRTIPINIKQIDFVVSIVKLFNLYVYENRDKEKHVLIDPYVDFFDLNVSAVVDWNYKMDRARALRIKPMSELNARYYEFNFKHDADYYNDLYKKRYNHGYGSLTYDSAFEFASDNSKVDIIFSATPLVGYAGEDKIYSTVFKFTNGIEEKIDTNIRILQTMNVTGVGSWDIVDGVTVLGSYIHYGYAGHYNDPDAPANDIHFGVPAELFFTLVSGGVNVTQFNVYWSSYMAEITDKDSKLLIAYFKLNNKDIYDIDFSKFIHVDGSYWRLNKITDWNASEPDVCQCELLKLINMIY